MAVKINGINHCAISVANIEETIKWYHDVFGFTVVNRSENSRSRHQSGTSARSRIFVGSI